MMGRQRWREWGFQSFKDFKDWQNLKGEIMDMKKIIEELERQEAKIPASKMDLASWGYEEGVLITGNEAKQIIDFFENIEHIINSGEKNVRWEIEKLLEGK